MIIGEPFSQSGSAYLGFNLNDDYDTFGGRGKAKRQEKKQVRQVKRGGKKINRLAGKMTKTVGKQQLRANNFGLTRRMAPARLPSAPAESSEAIQDEQVNPESPAEQAQDMPSAPQPEAGSESPPETAAEDGADAYTFYVGAPKSGEDKTETKKNNYAPLIGIIGIGAVLFIAGYALHKAMHSDHPKSVIKSRPINQYGYTRRTH